MARKNLYLETTILRQISSSRLLNPVHPSRWKSSGIGTGKRSMGLYDVRNHVSQELSPPKDAIASNQWLSIASFVSHYFNHVYLMDPAVQSVVQFLKQKGLADAQINDSFKDHMALRSPNIASGISLAKDLIDSGVYEYKKYLLSNHPDQQTPV